MIQVAPEQYETIRPLFDGLQYNLAVDSILRGNTPGQGFADKLAGAGIGLLWDGQAALLLAGSPDALEQPRAIPDLVGGVILPQAHSRGISALALHYYPLSWERQIETGWGDLALERTARRFYRFNRPKIDWRRELPTGYKIQRIDSALFNRTDLDNLHLVTHRVNAYWPSTEAFVDSGIGFCLLDSAAIRSWCISIYASGDELEFLVETALTFREHGDASLVAAACVEFCATQERVPHWHCWEDDPACMAVANGVGFWQPARYPVFRLKTDLS